MKLKELIVITILVLILLATSCTSLFRRNVYVVFYSEDAKIQLKTENIDTCTYVVKVGNIIIKKGTLRDSLVLDVLKKIKSDIDLSKEVALALAKNNNNLEISLSVSEFLDTMFIYHVEPNINFRSDSIYFKGIGARLATKDSNRNVDSELKRWLYHKREVFNDSLFRNLRNNYLFFLYENSNDYIVKGEIPVLHSIAGNKYEVSVPMEADYYAIVACNQQSEIDKYIENAVVTDYKYLSKNKSSITCAAQKIDVGYLCLMFLGINKDYSYQQIPMAIVAIDNMAPNDYYNINTYVEPSYIPFKNLTRIFLPYKTPHLIGYGKVKVAHWNGNGLECNVTFDLDFSGDCKSITIHRRGQLCCPDKYFGNHFSVANKTFYAKDGDRRFTWQMHFESGVNEIPITIEDYHGNKSTSIVNVRAEFVSSDAPQIEIENNIYN